MPGPLALGPGPWALGLLKISSPSWSSSESSSWVDVVVVVVDVADLAEVHALPRRLPCDTQRLVRTDEWEGEETTASTNAEDTEDTKKLDSSFSVHASTV